MAATAVVQLEGVSKAYPAGLWKRNTVPALREVSFRIEPGEVFALLGPNRAGKTTLVKILLSLCRPTAGTVTRFGRPVTERDTLKRVGYVHDNQAFPRYLNAAGLLKYYAALALVPYEEACRRVPRLLEMVGLADRSREPISRFSKGMVQRLAVAQALINDPDLLVLDEPNEGLDLAGRRLVGEIVRDQRSRGRTTLLVSHILTEVEQLCDRVGVLREGRLVYTGPVKALLRDPVTGRERTLEHGLQELYEKRAS